MSNLRNKVSLIGRVGIKPEKKEVGMSRIKTNLGNGKTTRIGTMFKHGEV